MRRLAILPLAILLTALPILAQSDEAEPPFGRANAAKEYLSLTDTQVENLRALQQQFREESKPTFEQIRAKTGELREAIRQETPDGTLIAQLRSDIAALREQIHTKRTDYRTQSVNVLNADQQTKLAALEEALKLVPAAHGAAALNLLEGPGMGFPGFGGRGFRGLGPGPGAFRGGPRGLRAPAGPFGLGAVR
jgi:Spy/CpxP family protein refolding chaperone